MAILRSGCQAGRVDPRSLPFKDLIGGVGRPTKLSKPKYADSTKISNAAAWSRWSKFCQKAYEESNCLSTSDPEVTVEKDLSCELVRAFLFWSCQQAHFGSSSSLFTYAKTWRMAVIENVRSPVDPAIKLDMKNYIMDVLIGEFGLTGTCRLRLVINSDGIVSILHYHWVICDDYYPEERQRVQHAGVNIHCGSTTARAGTVIESSGYFGTNEAMEYRDIQLYAVRDDEHPGGVKLGMLVQLRLLKGRRNRGNPPFIKFSERRDVPSFCFIKIILGLAFRDGAFASEHIISPRVIYGIRIPDRLNSVPIEWAPEWKNIPVFRRTVRDTKGSISTSPTQALQYSQVSTWNRRLGRSYGMKEPFELKMLRRGAAAGLTKNVPEGVRNQAMGHSNSTIHARYYQNQILDADIVSAYLDKPSDKALMNLMGHTSLTRDPSAPSKPTSAQREQARDDVDVMKMKERWQAASERIRKSYVTIGAARLKAPTDPKAAKEVKALDRLQRDHDKLLKQKVTELFEASREQYFATLGATCLENQHTGREEPGAPTPPRYRFSERAELAMLLFPPPTSHPVSYQEQVETSCRIIELYTSMCGQRESPRPREPLDKTSTPGGEPDIRPCFLDTEPDMCPVQCPGTQCLFCLGDTSLRPESRTKCFKNPFTLTRHTASFFKVRTISNLTPSKYTASRIAPDVEKCQALSSRSRLDSRSEAVGIVAQHGIRGRFHSASNQGASWLLGDETKGDSSCSWKIPPKTRGQDVRHYGWSDDEGDLATSPGKHPPVARPRRDVETHWAMQDDGTPIADKTRPISSHRNANLGLYQNHINTEEGETDEAANAANAAKRPLSTVTNIAHRNKDFGSSWQMNDNSPGNTSNENKRVSHNPSQMKHIDLMNASWGNYDQSPEPPTKTEKQKPVQKPAPQRKRQQDERHWGFGDDENVVEEKKPQSRGASAAGGDKSFWDF